MKPCSRRLRAGVTYAAAYPGTRAPKSSRILPIKRTRIVAEWAPNEKVAFECAMGAAIAGARALSVMKNGRGERRRRSAVRIAYSGVNGGLVLVSADDPGLHSSQNEQTTASMRRSPRCRCFERATAKNRWT